MSIVLKLSPEETGSELQPDESCRILLLSGDTPWAASFRETVKRLGFQYHRLDSAFDALAATREYDPHLLVVGDYNGELSIEDICDALRTPRQLRPIGLMLTTSARRLPDRDISDLGIDEIIQADLPAAMYAGSLLQHYRLAKMGRTLLLREQEILDNLPSPLFVADRDLVVWKANRNFAELLGDRDGAVRKLLGRSLVTIWPEAAVPGLQALQRAVRNQESLARFRFTFARRERTYTAQLTTLQFEADRILVDLRDVTEEEQSFLAEARRERLATIGNLSLGVAHEIQNPNTFSRVNADNLQELFAVLRPLLESLAAEHPEQKAGKLAISRAIEMVDSAIQGIHKASSRIAEVLDGLKQFGKTDSGHITVIDLHAAVAEAVLLTKHLVKDQCQLTVTLPESPLWVRAAAMQLSQVFVNLIENAVLAFRVQSRHTPGLINIALEQQSANELVIGVSDDGPGIDSAIQDKIFRPYFTTRAQGEGTGLGLSISSDIMHRFGGSLSVYSQAGRGSKFLMTLQCADKHSCPTEEADHVV